MIATLISGVYASCVITSGVTSVTNEYLILSNATGDLECLEYADSMIEIPNVELEEIPEKKSR